MARRLRSARADDHFSRAELIARADFATNEAAASLPPASFSAESHRHTIYVMPLQRASFIQYRHAVALRRFDAA